MTYHDDDDQLISGAFADFNNATAVRAIGTRALHTKAIRHQRLRKSMLGVASALIIALPVATYAALGQGNQGPPPDPAASSSPGHETPAPSPSPSPSHVPAEGFDMAYFAVDVNDKVEIYLYADGEANLKATIPDPSGTVIATLSVSPDQRSLAWVDGGHVLKVAAIDGTAQRSVYRGLSGTGAKAPVWTSDSRGLITEAGTVDATSGQIRQGALKGGYQVFSPGFEFTAYVPVGGPARVVVERADGTKVAEIPTICANCESNAKSVLGVSPDGRYVALGGWPTAGERETSWREILDTRTGQIVLDVEPPLGPKPGRFLANGGFVLHDDDKLKVLNVDGTVVKTVAMPEALTVHTGPNALRYPQLLLVK